MKAKIPVFAQKSGPINSHQGFLSQHWHFGNLLHCLKHRKKERPESGLESKASLHGWGKKWSKKGFSFSKKSLGQTAEGTVEGSSVIHSADTYTDEERGRRRFYSLKPCQRKSKGTLLVGGGEGGCPHEGKSFEDRDSPLSAVVVVCPGHHLLRSGCVFPLLKACFQKRIWLIHGHYNVNDWKTLSFIWIGRKVLSKRRLSFNSWTSGISEPGGLCYLWAEGPRWHLWNQNTSMVPSTYDVRGRALACGTLAGLLLTSSITSARHISDRLLFPGFLSSSEKNESNPGLSSSRLQRFCNKAGPALEKNEIY